MNVVENYFKLEVNDFVYVSLANERKKSITLDKFCELTRMTLNWVFYKMKINILFGQTHQTVMDFRRWDIFELVSPTIYRRLHLFIWREWYWWNERMLYLKANILASVSDKHYHCFLHSWCSLFFTFLVFRPNANVYRVKVVTSLQT